MTKSISEINLILFQRPEKEHLNLNDNLFSSNKIYDLASNQYLTILRIKSFLKSLHSSQ